MTAGLVAAVPQECEKCGTLGRKRLLEVLELDRGDSAWCNQCQECSDGRLAARQGLVRHYHGNQS